MVKLEERILQLRIEKGLSLEKFLEDFYGTYGYSIDVNCLCNDYLDIVEVGVIKDLCDFFDVSFNYMLGLSSYRAGYSSCIYDEIIGLASVVFSSDNYSADYKKDLYTNICKIFDKKAMTK